MPRELVEDLFSRVDTFWNDANARRRNLDYELLDHVYDMIQENFKKYPGLEHININTNVYYEDDETEMLDVSVNGYPDDLVGPDELEHEATIEQAMYYVVLERLSNIDHEFIFTRNTTCEQFQQAYGY